MDRTDLLEQTNKVLENSHLDANIHGLYIIAVTDNKLLVMNVGLKPLGTNPSVLQVFEGALQMAEDAQTRPVDNIVGTVELNSMPEEAEAEDDSEFEDEYDDDGSGLDDDDDAWDDEDDEDSTEN